jgi:hypothetical protein
MVVNASDVRLYLNNVKSDLISDASLAQAVSLAETVISEEASADCKPDTKDHAILSLAGWIAYGKYAAHIERAMGRTPTRISTQLEYYEKLKDLFLGYAKSGETIPQSLGTFVYSIDSAMTSVYRTRSGNR